MAAASPHKKMMVLSLQQLEGGLLNFERDRVNLITAVPFGPRTSDQLPFEVLLREADQCCKEQGEILLYITRLTLTPGYYERPHRIQRLLYLLDSLMHCVDTIIDAAERIHAHMSNEEWPSNQNTFIMARRMLSTGRDMIKIQQMASTSDEIESEMSSESFTMSADDMTSKDEYLQKPAPYAWDSTVQNILRELSYLRLVCLVGANTPEPFIECTRAAHSIVWITSRPLCKGTEALGVEVGHSNINSVWLSPMTDDILDKTNPSGYLRIWRAVFKTFMDMNNGHCRVSYFENPIVLALGLQDVNIEIGFIFSDEPSVVVWPLGKGSPTAKGGVMVHCTRSSHSRNRWSFKVLLPCISNKPEEFRASNMRVVQSPSAMTMTELPDATAPRKHESLSVPGATNDRSSFFDLSPEIRNYIYKECVERPCAGLDDEQVELCCEDSHDHYGEERSTHLGILNPPALCRTSRRVRDEVLPLILASKCFKVHVTPSPRTESTAWSLVERRILTYRNKWLARSSNAAYLRAIRFRGSSGDSKFRVWVRITDNSSKFRLTTDEETNWEPEKIPGGYNLPALLRIIILDKETAGLSMADVACVADFLGEKLKSWPDRTGN